MTYDKNPQATELDRKTVADALTENLTIKKNQYAQSTFKAYYRKTKQLQTLIGKELLVTVTTTKLELMIAKLLKRYKGNTVNHYLDILKQVFARAKSDGLIALSPMDSIKKCRFEIEEPQPFLKKEIKLLLQRQESNPIEVALIQLGLATGLRISELLAVSVEAFDLDKRILTVDLALVDGAYKTPKTKGSLRKIELTEQGIIAARILIAQASHRRPRSITVTQTDNRTKKIISRTLVAYNRPARRPYASVDEYRETFFQPHCDLVGVKYRGASQLRHTYASQLLSAGVNVEWIARQMGHNGTAMIERHYGRWLTEDAADFGAKAEVALHDCIHGDDPGLVEASKSVPAILPPVDLNALMANPQMHQQLMAWLQQALSNTVVTGNRI